ncbi:guanylyl cyclase-activating protein 3 isoform X2 [Cuculus canorus]|uniref:guanylyl cyclase-activating protein 3 isoform X2 n=1 Tax=Cuculus canorus TaxID=55661 RepID=UPI0023AB1C02|nr:guanylyl cyclase-activating protein 3 isoform X2 [Cuculus canorus]
MCDRPGCLPFIPLSTLKKLLHLSNDKKNHLRESIERHQKKLENLQSRRSEHAAVFGFILWDRLVLSCTGLHLPEYGSLESWCALGHKTIYWSFLRKWDLFYPTVSALLFNEVGIKQCTILTWLPHHLQVFCRIRLKTYYSTRKVKNHRMSCVGRDPQGSLSPTPVPTQDNPNIHAMCLKASLKCFLNTVSIGAITASLGSLFHCSITLWVKNLFLISNLTILWHIFLPFSQALSLVTMKKRSVPAPPSLMRKQ